MDKRISYKIVLDTETCPIDRDSTEVDPHNMFVYDIGWAVVDKRGTVYKTRSFINTEIFFDETELMRSAYYSKKIPNYLQDLNNGTRKLANLYTIRKAFLEDIKKYNVTQIFAHNAYFDYTSLQMTQRWLTKSKYRYFFPWDVTICDTLKMARSVIGKMSSYKRFCEKNNYLTKNGKVQLTAEVLYRFITKDTTFKESHTGLEDVLIEKEIMRYCYKQKKKMDRELFKENKKSS